MQLDKEEAKATCTNAVPLKFWGPDPKAHILKPREDSTSWNLFDFRFLLCLCQCISSGQAGDS